MTKTFDMVAKTLYGLEDVLAKELIELGANEVQIGRRIVSFEGDKALLYKANLYCRTALRILKPIRSFKAKDADEVYEQIKRISWEQYLDPQLTFAIDAVVNSETFTHSKFVSYKAKDAIVDYFTDKEEKRPSVRVNNPDLQLHLHISHNDCTIALDSSGESLHRRGYRTGQTEAPLNEVLAAGMILKTGWQGECDFIDPMCGSGTLLIEAAMIALNIAPGIYRKEYAFEKWADFDAGLFEEIYNDDSRERAFAHKIVGSDISPGAVDIAAANVKSAGLSQYIDLSVKSLQQYTAREEKGIVVTNPPYGERINSKDLLGLYQMIGERMKHVFTGNSVWILSYREDCFDNIGLRHSERFKLKNGALDCEFRNYEIFSGKRKEALKDKREGKNETGVTVIKTEYKKDKPYRQDRTELRDKPYRKDRTEARDRPYRQDRTEARDKPYRKDRTESRDKPYRQDRTEARDKPYRQDRTEARDKPYRKDRTEARDKPYRKDRTEARDKPYRQDRTEARDKPYRKDRAEARDKPSDQPENSSPRKRNRLSTTKTERFSLPNRHRDIEELKRKLREE